MTFTYGAQTHHEAGLARAELAWSGWGTIKNGLRSGAFDGVLLGEVGAHELPAGGSQSRSTFDPVGDELEVLAQNRQEIGVTRHERCHHLGQRGGRLVVVQPEDAVDHRIQPGTRPL